MELDTGGAMTPMTESEEFLFIRSIEDWVREAKEAGQPHVMLQVAAVEFLIEKAKRSHD